MARGTGFEPVAFGSGEGFTARAGDGRTSQPLATPRVEDSASGTRLPGIAALRARLGTSLEQQAGARSAVRYVTVRQFAELFGVSRATVYKAVATRELPHVRVSSAIRIPVSTRSGGDRLP